MRPEPIYPRHPRQVPGSKWTSPPAVHPFCHWEVEALRPSTGVAVLRATLDPHHKLLIPWRELRDRARWLPGWVDPTLARLNCEL
jgi:tryptophan-rich hypothetical protein